MTDFSYLESFCLRCGKELSANENCYGLHAECFRTAFEIRDEVDQSITGVSKLTTRARAGSAEEENDDSVRDAMFHGNYPKYTITIGGNSYIAKLGKTNDYNLIALAETISNRVAEILGINIPRFCLIFWKKRPSFIVKNFMSSRYPSNLIPLEDYWPRTDEGKMTEYEIRSLFAIVKERAGYKAEVQIVQLVIFDYLIGNADRHRGNIAFIQDKKGLQLAPIYDNVSDLGLEMEDFLSPADKSHPSMRIIVANSTAVSAQIYITELINLGYEIEVRDFVGKMMRELPKILLQIKSALYLTPNLKATFSELVDRRADEISKCIQDPK